jgi:hypothetical protein
MEPRIAERFWDLLNTGNLDRDLALSSLQVRVGSLEARMALREPKGEPEAPDGRD